MGSRELGSPIATVSTSASAAKTGVGLGLVATSEVGVANPGAVVVELGVEPDVMDGRSLSHPANRKRHTTSKQPNLLGDVMWSGKAL
jgi:hypothetical protein